VGAILGSLELPAVRSAFCEVARLGGVAGELGGRHAVDATYLGAD
jgi:hypothetical protein